MIEIKEIHNGDVGFIREMNYPQQNQEISKEVYDEIILLNEDFTKSENQEIKEYTNFIYSKLNFIDKILFKILILRLNIKFINKYLVTYFYKQNKIVAMDEFKIEYITKMSKQVNFDISDNNRMYLNKVYDLKHLKQDADEYSKTMQNGYTNHLRKYVKVYNNVYDIKNNRLLDFKDINEVIENKVKQLSEQRKNYLNSKTDNDRYAFVK